MIALLLCEFIKRKSSLFKTAFAFNIIIVILLFLALFNVSTGKVFNKLSLLTMKLVKPFILSFLITGSPLSFLYASFFY